MLIRPATRADLPAILEIHNDAIRTTTAIWDDDEVELDEREAWFDARTDAGLPILVAQLDGPLTGPCEPQDQAISIQSLRTARRRRCPRRRTRRAPRPTRSSPPPSA